MNNLSGARKNGNTVSKRSGHSHINGIHYYTLKAVVDNSGPENSAYAIAEVAANGDIAVTGYRRAVSMQLAEA